MDVPVTIEKEDANIGGKIGKKKARTQLNFICRQSINQLTIDSTALLKRNQRNQ